jgi:hypothetical protein
LILGVVTVIGIMGGVVILGIVTVIGIVGGGVEELSAFLPWLFLQTPCVVVVRTGWGLGE